MAKTGRYTNRVSRYRNYEHSKEGSPPVDSHDYCCKGDDKFQAALKAAGMLESVNTDHSGSLPLTLRGQVGQVTSYNALPARSK